jgi:hypothetical protein
VRSHGVDLPLLVFEDIDRWLALWECPSIRGALGFNKLPFAFDLLDRLPQAHDPSVEIDIRPAQL